MKPTSLLRSFLTAVTANDGIEKMGDGAVSITGAVILGPAQTWTNNSAGALTKTNASLLDNNGHLPRCSAASAFSPSCAAADEATGVSVN